MKVRALQISQHSLRATAIAMLITGSAYAQDLDITGNAGATAGNPAADINFTTVDDSLELGQENSGVPIAASITGGAIGVNSGGANSGNNLTTAGGFTAAATANSGTTSQALTATGQTGISAGQLQRNVAATTIDATVGTSNVGVTAAGAVTGTVDTLDTQFDALATGNNGTGVLDVDGTITAAAGAATVALDPGAATAADLTGDLSLGVVQENVGDSDVTATIDGAVNQTVGLALAAGSSVDGSTVNVLGTDSDATGAGNVLSATVDTNEVAGAGQSTAVGLVQFQSDSDVTATNGGLRVGISDAAGVAISNATSNSNNNSVNSAATGNDLAATAEVDVSGANTAFVGSAQELSAAAAVDITSTTDDANIGLTGAGSTVTGGVFVANENAVGSNATGQTLSQTVDPEANVGGVLDSDIDQEVTTAAAAGTATITATTSDVTLGVDDAAATIAGGAVLQTEANTFSANAEANVISNQSLGNLINNAGATSVDADQISGVDDTAAAVVTSTVTGVTVGVADNATALAAGSIGALTTIDNQGVSSASSNRAAQTLDGVVNNSGTLTVGLDQTSSANVDATSSDVAFGLDSIVNSAAGDGVSSAVISASGLTTSARGNQATQTVGSVDGNTAGAITVDLVQSNTDDADIDAAVSAVDVGVGLGGGGFATSLSVGDTTSLSETVGNLQTLNGPNNGLNIQGTIDAAGSAAFTTSQTNTFDGNAFSATTDDVDVGLFREAGAGAIGGSNAVTNTSVQSNLFGNAGASAVSVDAVINGAVSTTNTQTNTGAGVNELLSTVDGVRVGLDETAAASTVTGDVTVSDTLIGANLNANSGSRSVNASGVLNAGGSLAFTDSQSNDNIVALASIGAGTPVTIGATVVPASDLNLVVSDTVVSSSLNGNFLSQSLDAGGLLSQGGTVAQSANQVNTDGTLTALTSNVRAGLNITGDFSGSSIVRGSTLSASATGNAGSVSRRR